MSILNNNSLFNKTILAISTLITLTSFTANAKELDFSKTQKEIKIMSTIFETSLTDKNIQRNRLFESKKVQATYLADQGMLFSFNFSKNSFSDQSDWAEFGEGIGQFVGEIASEVGAALTESDHPITPRAPNIFNHFEYNLEEYEQQREELEAMRELQQDQRNEVRELQREIRQIERSKDVEPQEKNKVDKLKNELEQKLTNLSKKMDQYNKSMRDYRAQRDKKYTESSKIKSETIITTLCDYGTTLRSLKDNEHITIIFKNYAGEKDQVYVFDIKDVRGCDSKDKLIKSAISYQL